MKHLKLIDGLQLLEKEEWISLRKYVLMYCKKTSDNYELLDYLFSKRHQLGVMKEIELIKRPIFPDMTVKSFSNLMSKIFSWFEEWLVWYENKKDAVGQDITLVKIYNRKGAFRLANKTYRRVEKNIIQQQKLDLKKNKDLYMLHYYHYFSDNPVKYERKGEILETLVSYFLLQLKEQALLYVAELHNWGNLQNYDFSKEIELLDLFCSKVEDTQVSHVIELIIRLARSYDVSAFLALKRIVLEEEVRPSSELYIIASFYWITFSLRLWNNDKLKDPQMVFEAYDFGLDTGLLLSSGKMPFIRFLNLVTTLGYIKTTLQTYTFIDKWMHLVDSESQEAIQALGYAHLKFIEEKFDELIPLLVGQSYQTDWGRLRSGCLELIGLYEDRKINYGLVVNRVRNFKRVLNTYGRKNKDNTYKMYLNFVKVLDLLVKRDFIKKTIHIEDFSPVIFKKWLEKEIKAGQ